MSIADARPHPPGREGRRRAAVNWSLLRAAVAVTVLGVVLAVVVAPVGASSRLNVGAHLLTTSNLPLGWRVDHAKNAWIDLGATPCLGGMAGKGGSAHDRGTVSFVEGSSLPAFTESLATGTTVSAEFDRAKAVLGQCHSLTLTVQSRPVEATFTTMSFPVVGTTSSAYSLRLTTSGVLIGADIVLFRSRSVFGEVAFVALGTPTLGTVEAFADEAAAKAAGRAVSPPPSVSVTSAPVQIAHTASGSVAYREVGSGPPLVMIMGFAGTMETWDPRLVDALAHHYKVVTFDNAGVGGTSALRSPLTIDAMANQTSALITTLGLEQPDILGWSMGTMIAQALAVLHPTQVNRLVLCAAYPGTTTVAPSQKAINALTSGTFAQVSADLFPSNQKAAAVAYELSVAGYPKHPSAPASTVAAQQTAILEWWHGIDHAGKKTKKISAPTLVADGTADRLDPVANDRRVAMLIPGTQLALYRDAGHAFLFQDEARVVARIESFLEGPTASSTSW